MILYISFMILDPYERENPGESSKILSDKNWGFCETICRYNVQTRSKYMRHFMNKLQEAKLSILSSKECRKQGEILDVDVNKEICAWKKNHRKVFVFEIQKVSKGKSKSRHFR